MRGSETVVAPGQPHPAVVRDTADHIAVARVRAGDRAAFVALFAAHYVALRDFACGIAGSAEVAEEVVQDVFVRLWDMRTEWVVHGTVRGYLFGAVRHRALNVRRGTRAELARAEAWARERRGDGVGRASEVERALEASELSAALRRAIDRLPERCRLVYTLRWRYELSYAEIAQSLGIAIKTVEAQLTKALRMLRQELAAYR